MKKLLLAATIAVLAITNVNAQANIGLNVGLPSADADLAYSIGLTLDANYLFEVSDEIQVGPTVGYSHFLGKKIGSFTIDDAGFASIGGAGRYAISDEFTVGLDLGYSLGIAPEGNDGGVFYAPKVQYSISDSIDVLASYKGISANGGTFASINLGVEFGL